MIWLILSIFLSSLIFAGFKWFDLKKINLMAAICGNYISCILTGLVVNRFLNSTETTATAESNPYFIYICLGLGILFFFTFFGMAYVSAKIGVGIASASSKMSLIIPVLAGVLFFGNGFGISKFIALILALIAVVLMSLPSDNTRGKKQFILPFLIFLGSGMIDTALGMVEAMHLAGSENQVVYIFSGAFISSVIFILITQKHILRDFRSIGFGIALGIPNYFSILAIVKAMGSEAFSFHEFYMINNTGIMVLSFIFGLLLFKEKITVLKSIGLILSIISIYLVLYF